jgi:colicin import membrane protein
MKANKALKRLAKIEASMSNVAARYSASEPHTQEVLQDAKAAVARAREAVQASSRAVKNPAKPKRKLSAAPRRRRAQKRAAAGQAGRAAKKAAPVRKKAAVKKAAVKALAAKKKRAPIKAAVTKTAAKPTASAQYPMPAPGM